MAGACLVGTTVEFYDFFIYGTAAALVSPKLFFPEASPFLGISLIAVTFIPESKGTDIVAEIDAAAV